MVVFALTTVPIGSCSRDPIGYVDGPNSYLGHSLAEADASGNLKGKVRTLEAKLTGNCKSNSSLPLAPGVDMVWALFEFSLGRWPCRGLGGYFVQHVHGTCATTECDPRRDVEPEGSFEYWEAWRVEAPADSRKRKRFKPIANDQASYQALDEHFGWRQQIGEVRFYCLAPTPTSLLEPGEISHAESNQSSGPIPATNDTCMTKSGGLWGTKTEPSFWNRSAAAPIGDRHFELDWSCCSCKKSNDIVAWVIPAPEKEGSGLPPW